MQRFNLIGIGLLAKNSLFSVSCKRKKNESEQMLVASDGLYTAKPQEGSAMSQQSTFASQASQADARHERRAS